MRCGYILFVRKRFAVGLLAGLVVVGFLVIKRHAVLRVVIEQTIGFATGYTVRFANQKFGFTHGALIGVQVSRKGEPVLTAQRIDLWYSPRDLLPGSSHRYGISAVAIDRPNLTIVRNTDGSYNLNIPRASAPAPIIPAPLNRVPFRLNVRVRNATGQVQAKGTGKTSGATIRVANVTIDASINSATRTHYSITGTISGASASAHPPPFSVVGTIDMTRGYAMHRIRASALPLRALGALLINPADTRILAGTARNLDLRIYALNLAPGVPIAYHVGGAVDVAQVALGLPSLREPLRNLRGRVNLVDDMVYAQHVNASLGGIPVVGSGGVYDFSNLQYRVAMSGRGDLAQMRQLLAFAQEQPISGTADIGLVFESAPNGSLLLLNLNAPHASYRGIALDHASARAALNNGTVTLAPLRANADGAKISVRGTLAIGKSVVSTLALHAAAPANALPYAGAFLGSEPLLIDAIGNGTNTLFHARAAIASARGIARAAGLLTLEPDGEVAAAPVWIHTQRGNLDGAYSLNRARNTSGFWLAANALQLAPSSQLPITGRAIELPPILAQIDSARVIGGGSAGTGAVISGAITAHAVSIAGVQLRHVGGSFAGSLADATISNLRADGPWGTFAGNGTFSPSTLIVRGSYRGNLAGLRSFIANVPARGSANGTVAIAIEPNRTIVQAQNMQLNAASVRGIPLHTLSGTIAIANGGVQVYAAHANAAGGDVVAAGSYASGVPRAQQLALVGERLNAAELRGVGLPLDAGTLAVAGRMTPGIPLPNFTGGAAVAHGRDQRYAVAGSADFALAGSGIALTHVVANLDGIDALLSGRVNALTSGTPAYALQANIPAADVARTLQLLQLPGAASSGTYNARVAIGGRGLVPSVRGHVNVPAGSVNGLPFVDAGADIFADPSGAIARHGTVVVGSTHANFAAAARPKVSGIGVRAPHAHLSDFNNFFDTGDTLAGDGPVRLDLISRGHRITSNANIDIIGLRYRNLPIGDTRALWTTTSNTVSGSIAVNGNEGSLRSSGSVAVTPSATLLQGIKSSRYNLKASVSNLDLSLWVAALGFQSVPVTGRAFGNATVVGRYPQISLVGNVQLEHGTIGPFPIDTFQLGVHSQGARLNISQATVTTPGLTATATGSIGVRARDPLDLNVHATTNDLPRVIATLTRKTYKLSGNFEATAHIGGTFAAPQFAAAFDGTQVNLYGLPISSLFGSMKLHGNAVEVSNAGLDFTRGQATLAGTLPLQLSPFGIGPSNAPISLTLDVTDLDPSIFNTVLGNSTQLGGTIAGELGIGGTVSQPRIAGRFGISGGSYSSNLDRIPITATVASLTFNRTSATVDNFRAQVGTGSMSGHGAIAFPQGFGAHATTFDVRAIARGAQLDLPSYGTGIVDATLALTQTATQRATLSGNALLSNATIPFSAFVGALGGAPNAGGPSVPPLALGFRLHVAAGKGVSVRGSGYGAGLDIGAIGSADLGGTLAVPTLAGAFTSTGGTLTYFDRAFRVEQASVHFRPANGIIPTLHAIGTTHVVNSDPNAARNPYGSTDVSIKVDGQINALKVAFTSNPPGYTEDQILALIAPFGGFINGTTFSQVGSAPLPGSGTNIAPIGVGPLPGLAQPSRAATITVGQEAFNILNAQFTAGLLGPIESALSSTLGISDVNLTIDYYGNVGFTARRLLGRTVSLVYATTFGLPTRQSFGLSIAPNQTTNAQLSFFFQNGPVRLFQTPNAALSSNNQVTIGEPIIGQSGFAFTFQRLYW